MTPRVLFTLGLWKIRRNIQGKEEKMLKNIFVLITIALIVLGTGCSHKDDKPSERAPYKTHNKFHHKNVKE
jgi:hypothetical protein